MSLPSNQRSALGGCHSGPTDVLRAQPTAPPCDDLPSGGPRARLKRPHGLRGAQLVSLWQTRKKIHVGDATGDMEVVHRERCWQFQLPSAVRIKRGAKVGENAQRASTGISVTRVASASPAPVSTRQLHALVRRRRWEAKSGTKSL